MLPNSGDRHHARQEAQTLASGSKRESKLQRRHRSGPKYKNRANRGFIHSAWHPEESQVEDPGEGKELKSIAKKQDAAHDRRGDCIDPRERNKDEQRPVEEVREVPAEAPGQLRATATNGEWPAPAKWQKRSLPVYPQPCFWPIRQLIWSKEVQANGRGIKSLAY